MKLSGNYLKVSLLVIILVAAALRFYYFFELPFMWDELSAWSRLHFNSFSELIQKGVMPDGHPAGVQVFLYYWTFLFGDKEWIVKLPFNLMGLASVFILYRIGAVWFSKSSGIIAAAFAAALQFFVLYSPIARPYVSGLFFTLLMVLYWSLYMFKTPKRRYLILYILFSAISAYNHHFSLLFAAIVGFSGLLVAPKNLRKEYIISGIIIFILYIPHLKIFFHQLSIGGIGGEGLWLEKPNWSFIKEFIWWSFQYSYVNLILIVVFSVAGIVYCIHHCIYQKIIKISLLIIWFILPVLIGLVYSMYVNPVIQYSMLLFSFPYLLLLLSVFASNIPQKFIPIIVMIILVNNIYQLIEERKHYEIIHQQPFNLTAQLVAESDKQTSLIYNTIPSYQQYYLNKYNLININAISIYNRDISETDLDSLISQLTTTRLVTCGLPPVFENIIRCRFPYLIKRVDAYTMDIYVFSKEPVSNESIFSEEIDFTDFTTISDCWNINRDRIKTDSLENKFYKYQIKDEYGFTYTRSLIQFPPNAIIDFEYHISTQGQNIKALGVFEAKNQIEKIFWRGKNLYTCQITSSFNYRAYFSIDTRLMEVNSNRETIEILSYIWNKNHSDFNLNSISVSIREPNSIKYGLFDKID